MYGLIDEEGPGGKAAAGRRPSAAVDTCLEICERMQGRIKAEDPFAAPAATQSPASGFRTRSTVGMMINGCVLDSLVVGGPGYNCGQLDRGDIVLKVDNAVVASTTILAALIGDDLPGSDVMLTVQKGGKAGNVRVVKLQRMATERIADRRRTFELFTLIKDRATQLQVAQHQTFHSPYVHQFACRQGNRQHLQQGWVAAEGLIPKLLRAHWSRTCGEGSVIYYMG